jgi:hypothetical protein
MSLHSEISFLLISSVSNKIIFAIKERIWNISSITTWTVRGPSIKPLNRSWARGCEGSGPTREVRAAAPMGTQSPATEHHRTGRLVCWKHGNVSHSDYPYRCDMDYMTGTQEWSEEGHNKGASIISLIPVSCSVHKPRGMTTYTVKAR